MWKATYINLVRFDGIEERQTTESINSGMNANVEQHRHVSELQKVTRSPHFLSRTKGSDSRDVVHGYDVLWINTIVDTALEQK